VGAGTSRLPCLGKRERLRHLTRIGLALRDWRVPAWPYAGPIGVRERAELHVLDDWRYLGTARCAQEVDDLLGQGRVRAGEGFERGTFSFLVKTLARLPRRRIVPLPAVPSRNTVIEEGHAP
jgi:DNA polymerase-3 subunit epsilon